MNGTGKKRIKSKRYIQKIVSRYLETIDREDYRIDLYDYVNL